MDPDTFLPLAARLDTTAKEYAATEAVAAHLMPFSIEYNGPAPVDTYLILHKPDEKATEPVDLQADTEAVSAFRGRKIHGTKLQLPKNYTLGFFHMREEEAPVDFNAAPKSTRVKSSVSAVTAPPAPVRGSRFTLDDDEDEEDEEGALDHTGFHDYPSAADEPEETSAGPEPLAWAKHGLHPVASAGNSLWVWTRATMPISGHATNGSLPSHPSYVFTTNPVASLVYIFLVGTQYIYLDCTNISINMCAEGSRRFYERP